METFHVQYEVPTSDFIAHRLEHGANRIPDIAYFECAKQLAMEILRSNVVEFETIQDQFKDTVMLRARIDVQERRPTEMLPWR